MNENRLNLIFEVEALQSLALEANVENSDNFGGGLYGQTTTSESQRLDCIYDNEPFGFEKDPFDLNIKVQAQDPLKDVDMGVEQ